MTAAERHLVRMLARETECNRQKRHIAEKRLKALARQVPSVVALQPAWGETTAAVLVTEVGEPRCFETSSSYVKAFGLNLKIRSSGRYIGQLRITKRGSSVARRWLYIVMRHPEGRSDGTKCPRKLIWRHSFIAIQE